jgi:hypothetical protein
MVVLALSYLAEVFMPTRAPIAALAVLWVAVGCGGSSAARSGAATTRDSAGITIVENVAPAWSAEEAWTVSAEPTLAMGVSEGDADHEFFQITGLTRLSDGTIVVANSGTQQLRYYAADGSLRASAGRKGGGPGEFQALMMLIGVPGDSVLAFDAMNRRLSLFDAAGRHVRNFSTGDPGNPVPLLVVARLDDGTYVAQMPNTRIGPEMLQRKSGPARDSVYVLHVDVAGAPVDTFGLFPGAHVDVRLIEFGGRSMPIPITLPFSPGTNVAAAGDRVYVGVSDTYEIRLYARTGTLTHLIRKRHEPRSVTEADIDEHRARLLVAIEGQANPFMAQFRDAYANVAYPETMPAFGQLLLDREGNLWVAETVGLQDEPRRWSVFDRERQWLGDVTTPARLLVREIGADYVLGSVTDDTEVERVLVYDLVKPADTR